MLHFRTVRWILGALSFLSVLWVTGLTAWGGDQWLQFKYDARHSGDVPGRSVETPLGLVGSVSATDGIYTAPVVAGGRVFLVDGSGVAMCVDAASLDVVWTRQTRGGPGNVNNVSSPAVCGGRLHFGTMAGYYYVLDCATGDVIREIDCGDPIFSTPVVSGDRAYFATLGAQVHCVEADGSTAWTWDFVKEVLGFEGDRWSGEAWHRHKQGRVDWRDHFCCSRNLSMSGEMVVAPCGGRTVFLQDAGAHAEVRAIAEIPDYAGREYPATFGQSVGPDGSVYVQWHRRDNAGRVERIRLTDGQVQTTSVPGTETAIQLPDLLSFASVSIRGDDIYRVRPEVGLGLCVHRPGHRLAQPIAGAPSIASPILLARTAVFGGLDGRLHVASLSGDQEAWSYETPYGSPITAPVAVCDGRIYFGCEDGILYVLGPDGRASEPVDPPDVSRIRTPLGGPLADSAYDWYTNYGDMGSTNAKSQPVEPPLKLRWIGRVDGTVKHIPVCGGGRMYTHTAEGQITAVEQETGRLLWRRHWPGVHLSYTSPLYYRERLLVPQAGMAESRLRCLDAATGRLLWEAPFTGSPSWSRQFPPVVHDKLVIYASGSGRYAAQGSEKPFIMQGEPVRSPDGGEVMSFIYSHDNPFYPKDNRPLIWAWDLESGQLVWKKDFSEYGSGGNDCGLALMDGQLYYSTFFGYMAGTRRRRGIPDGINGLTASLDPETGHVRWMTTDHYVTAGCTLSAKDGRLYLGGYNAARAGTEDRYIWCLDAKDGSLVWRSDPVASAVNVVSVGEDFLFSNAIRAECHLFDKQTGKITYDFDLDYACTRFTLSGPYLMGANMDMLDLSRGHELVATGPAVDSRECLGSSVSNGRIFYTSQASGLQVSAVAGEEARTLRAVWERP